MKAQSIAQWIAVAVVLFSVALWWFFGYSTEKAPIGTLRMYRYFGRVVRVDADVNGDGRTDESYRFRWTEPMRHHQPPMEILSDRDHDGRWDVWSHEAGHDEKGRPLVRFRVDTNKDGQADWTFVALLHENSYARIKARRGF